MTDFAAEDVTAATKAVTRHVNTPTLAEDEYIARAVLAAVLPEHDKRVRAEADERHAEGYCCCGCSMTPEHDRRVRAEALREAADYLAMRIGRSDGTPALLRARADGMEKP